jgi:hypothetical protein
MSSISIHNLDSDIEYKIKQLAEKKHQSLNKTLKEILEEKFENTGQKAGNRKRFEKFCGSWNDDEFEEFQAATEDFSRIDQDDWK